MRVIQTRLLRQHSHAEPRVDETEHGCDFFRLETDVRRESGLSAKFVCQLTQTGLRFQPDELFAPQFGQIDLGSLRQGMRRKLR